jgi:LysR family cyn operon transcriptional activator
MPSIVSGGVELRHLRYFRALAEAGSFTRAAAEIGLTQPTLSQQIAQLERELGMPLITRGRREWRLTQAGELVLQYSRRVIGDLSALRRSLDELSNLRRGSLTVAVLPVFAQRLLPIALANFHQAHPEIRVSILEMTVDEMAKALAQGDIDVGIGCLGTSLKLKGAILFSEELVAILPQNDPLAERSFVTVAELAKRPVIVPPPGYGTRNLILAAWAKVRRPPIFSLEVGALQSMLHAVKSGGGCALMPASALWGVEPDGWLTRKINGPSMCRDIGFLVAMGGERGAAIEALLPIIRSAVRELAVEG